MSPRWIVDESLSTIIRSPGWRVGVIEGDGTTNAWTAYARRLVVMMPMAATVTNSVSALRIVGRRFNQSGMGRHYICRRRSGCRRTSPGLAKMDHQPGDLSRVRCRARSVRWRDRSHHGPGWENVVGATGDARTLSRLTGGMGQSDRVETSGCTVVEAGWHELPCEDPPGPEVCAARRSLAASAGRVGSTT